MIIESVTKKKRAKTSNSGEEYYWKYSIFVVIAPMASGEKLWEKHLEVVNEREEKEGEMVNDEPMHISIVISGEKGDGVPQDSNERERYLALASPRLEPKILVLCKTEN